jgi:hypothetical protein
MRGFCVLAFCAAKHNKPYASHRYPSTVLLGGISAAVQKKTYTEHTINYFDCLLIILYVY